MNSGGLWIYWEYRAGLSSAFSFFQKGNIYICFVLAAVCNENLMSSWLGCFRLDTGQGVAISRRALLGARPELLHLDFFLHHDSPFPRGSFEVGELRKNSRPLSRQGCQAATLLGVAHVAREKEAGWME